MTSSTSSHSIELMRALQEARVRTLELVADLSDEQTLGYPAPRITPAQNVLHTSALSESEENDKVNVTSSSATLSKGLGDAEVPGGTFRLGSTPDVPFVFDNEMWAHPVEVKPFAIS